MLHGTVLAIEECIHRDYCIIRGHVLVEARLVPGR